MKHTIHKAKATILPARKYWMACLILLFSNGAYSEITLDGSLGPKGSVPGPNFEIKASMGRQAGSNLFHSFGRFNIHQGESATFSGPNSVANILSRVTGGSSSTINGLLRSTISGADFYLINPAGVMFGPHASLDVQGSFHVGTADYIGFPDGLMFDAHDLQPPVTLSVASPEAFGFLGGDLGSITLQGANLQGENLKIPQGETLSFIGGDVEITDGFRQDLGLVGSQIESFGGKINIASVASNALVNLSNSGLSIQTINPAHKSELGKININNRSSVRVNESRSEGVYIRGGHFILSNRSLIRSAASTSGKGGDITIVMDGNVEIDSSGIISSTSGEGHSGDIQINAGDNFSIINVGEISTSSGVFDFVGNLFVGSGSAGNIDILSKNDATLESSRISSFTNGTGNTGKISINSVANISLNSDSIINTLTLGDGNSGSVSITANDFKLINQSHVATNNFIRNGEGVITQVGNGNSGSIEIKSTKKVFIGSNSEISTSTASDGNSGDLTITTGFFEIKGPEIINLFNNIIQTGISSNTGAQDNIKQSFGEGKAGNIMIHAKEGINISGLGQVSSSSFEGKGGSIVIETPRFFEMNGGQIAVITTGSENAGNVEINARDVILKNNAVISADSGFVISDGNNTFAFVGKGSAGEITINANNSFIITNFSKIQSFTFGNGNGGKITIGAKEIKITQGGGIAASTYSSGMGGDIIISGKIINLSENGIVLSQSTGSGNAGNIQIIGALEFRSEDSNITTEATQSDGGNITLKAKDLISLKDSSITASVKKGGNGGNIDIDPQFVILDNSQIIAQAEDGAGGNINITADFLFASPNSIIDASSDRGINGQVNIDAPDTEILGGLEALSTNFLDASSILSKPCAARTDLNNIRFAAPSYAYEVLPQAPDVLQVHLPSLPTESELNRQQEMGSVISEQAVIKLSSLTECYDSM